MFKVIPIQPFSCKTNNEYAELASFADDDEDDNYIWDHRHMTTPKSFLLTTTRIDARKKLAIQDNILDGEHNELMTDTSRLIKAVHYAIFDSAWMSNVLIEGAPVINKCVALNPVPVTLPNGKTIKSTHTCNLDITWLPNEITEAHIVLGLSYSSLILARNFCDAGCKV